MVKSQNISETDEYPQDHSIEWREKRKSKEESQSATMEPKIERRAFKRVKLINWPAKILIKDRSINGTTRNISPQGAFIYCFQPHGDERPLKVHKVVDLIIEAPGVAPLFIQNQKPVPKGQVRVQWLCRCRCEPFWSTGARGKEYGSPLQGQCKAGSFGSGFFTCAEVIWSNILSSDKKKTLLGMGLLHLH